MPVSFVKKCFLSFGLVVIAACQFPSPVRAQQSVTAIVCNTTTHAYCSTTENPGNGSMGTPAWYNFGQVNILGQEFYTAIGPNGTLPTPMYGLMFNNNGTLGSLSPSAIGEWCLDWTSLASPPTLVSCGSSAGGVSSVGLTTPSWLTVSGSPITASGTLAISGTIQPNNYVLASAVSGANTVLTPRLLSTADIPLIPLSTGVTGTLAGSNFPTLTGDVTNTNLATTVGKVNGATIPTNACTTATNGSGQFTALSCTGTGNNVLANSPTLVTPNLGTPSSANLTNATGLPITTGVSGLGTGVSTFLAAPSSANLASAVTGSTGTGALVFGTSPTLTTPNLGTPSAINLANGTNLPNASVVGLGTFATQNYASPPAIGGTTPAAGSFSSLKDTAVTGATQCLEANSAGTIIGTGSICGSGTATAFSTLTSSTNTTANMVVGTGASISATGTGSISATNTTNVNGASIPTSAAVLSSNGVNQVLAAATTGSGAVVLANSPTLSSPTLTTPSLGTPSTLVLTNATGLPNTSVLGLGTFATQNFATPPAIGSTTPAAGSFSSLTDTGITGATQCVHVNSSGTFSGTGVDCGTGSGGSYANPTATIGLTAVNGIATTGQRSDSAPALSQAITPTWTGLHKYTNGNLGLLGSSTGYTQLESGLTGTAGNTIILPTTSTDILAGLGTAQTFTAPQSFANGDLLLKGSTSGAMTLEAPALAGSYVMTFPATTDTVAVLGTGQTFTAPKTFGNNDLLIQGSSTGSTTLASGNATSANYTATLPANSGTIAETNLAQTYGAVQTFGNNISIGGVTPTGATGTGNLVFSNSPTLITPALGTPTALVATNATGTAIGLTAGAATNVAGGVANEIPYQTSAGTTAFTPPASPGYLNWTGTAFQWQSPSGGGNVSNSGTPTSGQVAEWVNATTISGVTATGTGSPVLAASPTITSANLVSPNIGAATGSSLSVSGQLTSTVATGTAPLVVSSTTNVPNLNAASVNGATMAAPGTIGGTTPGAATFTNLTSTGTVSGTGFSNYLASPPAIGTVAPAAGVFTTLNASGATTVSAPGTTSQAALSLTGAPYSGGTASTNYPLEYLNDGIAPTSWSANGTEFGVNAPSGFTGNFLDFHVNGGASVASLSSTGALTVSSCTGCGGAGGSIGAGTTGQIPYYAANGSTLTATTTLPTAAMPALTGDVTSTAGSLATSVVKVNGAAVPTSAALLASNGSAQLSGITLGADLAINSGTLSVTQPINAQTGTTYAMSSTDAGKLVTFNNASSVAVSLVQATTAGYTAGYSFDVQNRGAGVVTITPNTSTINSTTNLTISQNQGCTVTSDGTNYQVSSCTAIANSGTSGAYNTLNLCTYSSGGNSVDPTGATDSLPAVTAAFAAYGGTNTVIQVNCPIFLNIASSANQIYVKSFTNVTFGPSGSFIVNNVGANVFMLVNVTDGVWTCNNVDGCFQYVANPGALIAGCGATCGVYGTGVAAQYTALKTYLAAHGITFGSGGNPAWQGQSPFLPIINMRGATQRIVFRNMTFVSPQGTSPANYMPSVVGMFYEYDPSKLGSTPATSSNSALSYSYMSFPTDIEFDHPTLDGYMMGFQGSCDCRFNNVVGKRYTDMQDGTSGSITFSAALGSGVTSATLSSTVYPSGWALPTGIYAVTLSNAQTVCTTLTQGSLTAANFINCSSGSGTPYPTTSAATPTGITGNIGGYNTWFAPPHLFYIYDQQTAATPQRLVMRGTLDYGWFNTLLSAERSPTGSGTLLSFKGELSNNTIIDGYISLRPEGFLDLEPCGTINSSTCGGSMRNTYIVYNSATAVTSPGTPWAMRFTGPTNGLSFDGLTIIDTATEPVNNPVPGGFGWQGDTDLSFTNVKYYLNDYPLAATYNPCFAYGGDDHLNFQGECHLANFTGTATSKAAVIAVGSNLLTNSNIDVSIFGWRQYPMTFTTTPAIGDTTEVLSTSWPYGTGTVKITLSDGSVRCATVSASTTMGPFTNCLGVNTPLTVAATSSATAGNMLSINYTGYEARMSVSQQGKAIGNHIHIRDVDNNWEVNADGQTSVEKWRQEATGQPGTTTAISFPSYFAITNWSWQVDTALTGVTGTMGIGTSGATTSLCAACTITTTNSQQPYMSPLVSTGTAITLTPSSGAVTGGAAQLSVEATSMTATH